MLKNKYYLPVLHLLMALFLGSTIALSYFVYKTPTTSQPSHEFLDPTLSLVQRDHMIVGFQNLRLKLNEIVTNYDSKADISIYFEFLNTGANISINKDLRIIPASLTKIPTAIVILKKKEKGVISFDTPVVMTEDVIDKNSGTLFQEKLGSEFTIRFLLEKSIHESDNTANKMLYNQITPQDAIELREELGLEELFDSSGKISAKEYSRVIRSLYTSSYLTPENSDYLLKLMSEATEKRYLSSGLPQDVTFAHKYGADITDGVFNDSGIVYVTNRPYLLTVMIEGNKGEVLEKDDATKMMKEISETIYSEVLVQ